MGNGYIPRIKTNLSAVGKNGKKLGTYAPISKADRTAFAGYLRAAEVIGYKPRLAFREDEDRVVSAADRLITDRGEVDIRLRLSGHPPTIQRRTDGTYDVYLRFRRRNGSRGILLIPSWKNEREVSEAILRVLKPPFFDKDEEEYGK